MKKPIIILLLILLGLILAASLVFLAFYRAAHPANANFSNLSTIRAIRVDYIDEGKSRAEVAALETHLQQAGVNLVAVGAGRVDWTYFPWPGHPDLWSSDVKKSGHDYLLEDSSRFGKWAHVSAVVDVLAPLYIQAHPEAAAVSWTGIPSLNLVGTMELVNGQFGQELLSMLDEIAKYYPVNSIILTELSYYTDGFGEPDKAAYLDYTGRTDWPRTENGAININEPSIGIWRAYEITRFLEKAEDILHRQHKLLFLEARISQDPTGQVFVENGADFNLFLKYADRLVVRGGSDPAVRSQASMKAITNYLARYPKNQVITGLGLWSRDYDQSTPKSLMTGIPVAEFQSALQGVGGNLWVTPSFLMTESNWQALADHWNSSPIP